MLNYSSTHFSGKVIIIGAGAGGLTAGYLLQQLGIDFEILEASSSLGGRMKVNTDFTAFPIPLGAEWIETRPEIFSEIVNDPLVQLNIKTIHDAPDYKFVNSSWYQFFEKHIIPSIVDKIVLNTVVKEVNYVDDKVIVSSEHAQKLADQIIVSVPLKVLQAGNIQFIPALPNDKQNAIDNAIVWDGFKAFFEFSDRFYDVGFENILVNTEDGQKIFYDASYGQNSAKNIVGLFTVGAPVGAYNNLSESQLKEVVLNELTNLFSEQIDPLYIQHISQNWNKEPFIGGGYLSDYTDWQLVKKLGEPVQKKVYFAGGAYTDGEDWVSVHTAAQSAKKAVDAILF